VTVQPVSAEAVVVAQLVLVQVEARLVSLVVPRQVEAVRLMPEAG
jgi:hypothetical protein